MYNLIYFIFLFIFVLAILFLNLPKLSPTDYLYQKIYVFVAVFFFDVVILIADGIYRGCVLDLKDIGQTALIDGLIAVIGIAVYQDIIKNNDQWIDASSPEHQKFMMTTVIVFFIVLKKFMGMLFDSSSKCSL